jgi:hypothetical protein
VTFVDLIPSTASPKEGHPILGKGFPRDLSRLTFRNERVVFTYLEWTEVAPNRSGLAGFDPTKHFLAPFGQTDPRAHPLGLSGSAMWFRRAATPEVWRPNMDVAGVTVGFYENARLLKVVKRESIEAFLMAHWPL